MKGTLADDFSLYLHAPTVTDPSLAPEGCEAFYVLAPVPHLGISDVDWRTEGPRYADRILVLPRGPLHPESARPTSSRTRIFTPLDFKDTLQAHHGSAFSLEPVLTQSAWFRVHNRDSRIGGLYFVGAGTHPGAGVPGVVNSAKATAGLMVEDLGVLAGREMSTAETVAAPDQAIRAGSKSFALASRLFAPATRPLVWDLYAWCRHCDDVTDGQVSGHGRVAVERQNHTRRRRCGASRTAPLPVTAAEARPSRASRAWSRRRSLPRRYVHDHLAGFAHGRRRAPLRDASTTRSSYCYHVAGVVGLMMAWIMGVRDEDTLLRGCDLGLGFQLTNIARDVERRCGERAGVSARGVASRGRGDARAGQKPWMLRQGTRVVPVVERLLDEADRYYASASVRHPGAALAVGLVGRHGPSRLCARSATRSAGEGPRRGTHASSTTRAQKMSLLLQALGDAVRAVTLQRQSERAPRHGLWTPPSAAVLGSTS